MNYYLKLVSKHEDYGGLRDINTILPSVCSPMHLKSQVDPSDCSMWMDYLSCALDYRKLMGVNIYTTNSSRSLKRHFGLK
jgi:hypothetical protein